MRNPSELAPAISHNLNQVETTASLHLLLERCERLAIKAELEGDEVQCAAYELACVRIREANRAFCSASICSASTCATSR